MTIFYDTGVTYNINLYAQVQWTKMAQPKPVCNQFPKFLYVVMGLVPFICFY